VPNRQPGTCQYQSLLYNPATRANADFAPDDEIRNILRDRIDRARQSVGIVACLFDSGG
jgi:hypothetical protein